MKKTIIFLFVILALISLVYAIIPDDDGDGIPNSEDNCSNSNGTVDNFGCDCTQKNDSNCNGDWCCLQDEVCIEYDFRARCAGDSDKDGVFDINDRCADTNSNEAIDSFGCSCSQKVCNDYNPCTDDYCNNTKAECVFVGNDSCTSEEGIYSKAWWEYNPDKGETKIYYTHSAHTIDVNFEEPLKEDVIILDSTSNVISYGLNENRTRLNLIVEGDPDVEGVTTIKTMQKPVSVSIDKIEIAEHKEKLSPTHYVWIYLSAFLVLAILILILILSLRKHEDVLLSSIKKGENKLERDVGLEAELQLKMYILTNVRRGYTAQQIRDELLKDGWRRELVDRAFNSLRR